MTGKELIPHLADFYHRRWPIVIGTNADGKGPTYPRWQNGLPIARAGLLLSEHPRGMVGVILGPRAGIWDLEVDDAEGLPIVSKLLGDNPPLTPTFQRPGGYPHRIFAWDERLNAVPVAAHKVNDSQRATLFEFRLGHVAAEQSIFPPSGGRRWLIHPDECPFTLAPDSVVEYVLNATRRPVRVTEPYVAPTGPASIESANLSNATRQLLSAGAPQESGWNDTIFKAACDMCGCGVPEGEALAALVHAANPWNPHEERAVIASVRSAYRHERRPARPQRTMQSKPAMKSRTPHQIQRRGNAHVFGLTSKFIYCGEGSA